MIIFAGLIVVIFLSGFSISKKYISTDRNLLHALVAIPLGFTFLIFFLNFLSLFVSSQISIFLSYALLVFMGVVLKPNYAELLLGMKFTKENFYILISVLFWSTLWLLKVNKTIFGGDVSLYYSIAIGFVKNNLPPVVPWQPGLPLSYHHGSLYLLGAMKVLTGLSFNVLHRLLAFISLTTSCLLLVFMWQKIKSIYTFIVANAIPIALIMGVGLMRLIYFSSLNFSNLSSLKDIFFWIREMPSAFNVVQTYGSPTDGSIIVYFYYLAVSLCVFLSFLFVFSYANRSKLSTLIITFLILLSLALTNETMFVPSVIFIGIVYFFNWLKWEKSKKIISIIFALVFVLLVFVQGGMISYRSFIPGEHKSFVINPKKEEVQQDFVSFQKAEFSSKKVEIEDYPGISWYHLGIYKIWILASISAAILLYLRDTRYFKYSVCFLVISFFAYLAFRLIIPQYKIENGGRFIIFAYQLSVMPIFLLLLNFSIKKIKIVSLLAVIYLSFSWLMPSLFQITVPRTINNELLINSSIDKSSSLFWIKSNMAFSDTMLILDEYAPYSTYVFDIMQKAGVSVPLFNNKHKAYTLELSPEYIDAVTTLNPDILNELNVSYIYLDSGFMKNLPEIRKSDLSKNQYFKTIYERNNGDHWEKILKIQNLYYQEGENVSSTLMSLDEIIPKDAVIYIDDWENVHPWASMRKSLLYLLRDRTTYYVWGPGSYLNVEVYYTPITPDDSIPYDYKLLVNQSLDKKQCDTCGYSKIWEDVTVNISLWKKIN